MQTGSNIMVTVGGKSYAALESFTRSEALVMQLIFLSANYACYGRKKTVIDYSGRHQIAFATASKLVKRELLKSVKSTLGELHGKPYVETRYRPTRRGEQAVRALEKAGWSLEWLKEQMDL